MGLRVEWRTRGKEDDAVLLVDDTENRVHQAHVADPDVLRDFLNDMERLTAVQQGAGPTPDGADPAAWGELVMARSASGEILNMDPERYWDAIYLWFRSRGVDPHAARR